MSEAANIPYQTLPHLKQRSPIINTVQNPCSEVTVMETIVRPESLTSHGHKNLYLKLEIALTGQQVYDLLEMLETRAVEETCYLRVRQAVVFSELVREQVRAQGF